MLKYYDKAMCSNNIQHNIVDNKWTKWSLGLVVYVYVLITYR